MFVKEMALMKRLRKISTYLLITTLLAASISPAYVYADEVPVVEDELVEVPNTTGSQDAETIQEVLDIIEESPDQEIPTTENKTESAEKADPEGREEVSEVAVTEDTVTDDTASDKDEKTSDKEEISDEPILDPDTITAIDSPVNTNISLEYKPALDELLKEMPETVTIHRGEESETVSVNWICDGDYDELLGEYPFIPDMQDYKLAEGLELPRIIVTFENEGEGEIGGFIRTELAYDVPTVSSGRLMRKAVNLPSSHNPYENQILPVIRDQSPYGTCWAFATIGAIETDLIASGDGRDTDLSELHLAYFASHNYEDPKQCRSDTVTDLVNSSTSWLNNGGDAVPAMRYLSNLVGVVSETEAPYSASWSFYPDNSLAISKDSVQIRNAYLIGVSDTDNIKSAIIEHGGVYAAYYESHRSSEYSATYNSYNAISGWPNHAVMLVGWDDSFPKENFVRTPDGNGAWLVRNSWGHNGYGHSGYFWLSYYDSGFNRSGEVIAFDATTDTFDNCYAYDGQPLYDTIYYASNGSTVTETYNVNSGEAVKGVGFELGSANVKAEVTVTNKRTGASESASVNTTYAGFYTAELGNAFEVPGDATVEVSIRYTSDNGESIRVVCERTGSPGSWGDLVYTGVCDKGFYVNGNRVSTDPRMKLYTDDSNVSATGDEISGFNEGTVPETVTAEAPETEKPEIEGPVPVSDIRLNKTKATIVKGKKITLTAAVNPENADNRKVKWKSSNKKVATVSSDGVVKAIAKGTATITCIAKDGSGKYATCKVTVKNPVAVKAVSLNTNKIRIKKGKTVTLTAKIKPSNATNKKVIWSSSNPKVATVSSTGVVKAKKRGTAIITVTTKNGKKTAKCKVIVK